MEKNVVRRRPCKRIPSSARQTEAMSHRCGRVEENEEIIARNVTDNLCRRAHRARLSRAHRVSLQCDRARGVPVVHPAPENSFDSTGLTTL
jgi:hypothetical protein